MMEWKPLTVATALVATMAVAVPGYAANDVAEWDADNEAGLSADEYRTGLEDAGVFAEWDTNDDDLLSRDEFDEGLGGDSTAFVNRFGDGFFATWDANDDDYVDEGEFYESTYAAYDADENDIIEEPELGDLGDDMGDGGFWDV